MEDYENSDIFSSSAIKESSLETIKYLQDKLEKSHFEYQNILKERNNAIKELKNQISTLNEQYKNLKEIYDKANEEIMKEQLISKLKVEEAKKLIDEQKKSHKKEIELLSQLLERSKFEIKNLSQKLEAQKKEAFELKNKISEIEKQKMDLSDKMALIENNLNQSKKAVEETLGNLFEERKKTSEYSKKVLEQEKMINSLKSEIDNMRSNWDAERKEWRELWERERSVWETHRQEFAIWEERLRQEREAWLERLKKEEEKGVDYASNISKILEDTSKWSEKVTQVLKLYATKGIQLPHVFVTPEVIKKKTVSSFRKLLAVSFVSALMLSALVYWIYDYNHKLHFALAKEYNLEDSNYTALSVMDKNIFIANWNKGISIRDENNNIVKNIALNAKISALYVSGEYIWALDMSQLRFIKIDIKTSEIINSIKSAGPAPQALAFDGFNLWAFDASTGLLYKYYLNGSINGISTYNLKEIKNMDSMQFIGDNLYVLSNGELFKYNFKNENFDKIFKQKLNVSGFNFNNGYAYFLEKGVTSNKWSVYKIKNGNMLN